MNLTPEGKDRLDAMKPKFQPFAQCSRRDFVLYSCGFGG